MTGRCRRNDVRTLTSACLGPLRGPWSWLPQWDSAICKKLLFLVFEHSGLSKPKTSRNFQRKAKFVGTAPSPGRHHRPGWDGQDYPNRFDESSIRTGLWSITQIGVSDRSRFAGNCRRNEGGNDLSAATRLGQVPALQ